MIPAAVWGYKAVFEVMAVEKVKNSALRGKSLLWPTQVAVDDFTLMKPWVMITLDDAMGFPEIDAHYDTHVYIFCTSSARLSKQRYQQRERRHSVDSSNQDSKIYYKRA